MNGVIEFEEQYVKKYLNIDLLLEFQKTHDVQVIREADYSYHCYIDKKAFGTAFTPMYALVFGINQYLEHKA